MLSKTKHPVQIQYLEDGVRCEAICRGFTLGTQFDFSTQHSCGPESAAWVPAIAAKQFGMCFTFANLRDLVDALIVAEQSRPIAD